MAKTILVTGGAGYIGSHTTRHLIEDGFNVVVLDNLYSGHRWAVHDSAEFVEGNAGDQDLLADIFNRFTIEAVIHFAGHIVVPESVENPQKYYQNNCLVSQSLVEICRLAGINKMIFSSSAAVYGIPEKIPAVETDRLEPINPYGRTKLITEWLLEDIATSAPTEKPFKYVALRYFNVAGAAVKGGLGQATPEATHLLKVACEVATGKRETIKVFGTDYDTPDGTCIRDYIHVDDLASAHVVGLKHLINGGGGGVYNCGYGRGLSVQEILDTVTKVSNVDFPRELTGRRAGDPPALIADTKKITEQLGWEPKYNDTELICRTAFEWEQQYKA
ncbi:MAG TPA: UDP-glucose 4-epimerase GalE [Gammaproteobacteria bacterium]|nr:UDP-glucose 4-epimerase GalE [Gammaproteobacteria bacterium]